ncbi:hypothetical protein Tco_0812656 [Tanacetum coccineum]
MTSCTSKGIPLALPWGRTPRLDFGVRFVDNGSLDSLASYSIGNMCSVWLGSVGKEVLLDFENSGGAQYGLHSPYVDNVSRGCIGSYPVDNVCSVDSASVGRGVVLNFKNSTDRGHEEFGCFLGEDVITRDVEFSNLSPEGDMSLRIFVQGHILVGKNINMSDPTIVVRKKSLVEAGNSLEDDMRNRNIGFRSILPAGVIVSYIDIGDCEWSDRHFMENVRAYNQMFAMTYFGAHVDESVNRRRGPYVFKISGKVMKLLMHHITGYGSSSLNPEIVRSLILFLNEHNELVKLFWTARDKCNGKEIHEFRIRIYSVVGAWEYDLSTSQTLGAIVFENRPDTSTDYDVIIESKDGAPQRINKYTGKV